MRRLLLCTGSCLLLFACEVDLGQRAAPARRTFGEIIYREACQRVIYSAELEARAAGRALPLDASGATHRAFCDGREGPPAASLRELPVVGALASYRPSIVSDIDRVVPEALLDPLDLYLRSVLPLQDDGTFARAVRGSGAALRQLSADAAAREALSRLGWRDGFRPAALVLGRHLLDVQDLDALLGSVLPVLSPSSPGRGDAPAEGALRALLAALLRETKNPEEVADPGAADRTLALALRLLFTEDAALATLPAGRSYPAVLRDHRGVAQLNLGGPVPPPFSDHDRDGLPDLAADGRFLDERGQVLPAVTPFPLARQAGEKDNARGRDADGRALTVPQAGGAPLYRYIDLDRTVLAALLRDSRDLLDPGKDIPLGLLSGAGHLAGPRAPAVRTYPDGDHAYLGFDAARGALLPLAHGYVQLLGYSDIGDGSGADVLRLLDTMRRLLAGHEGALARSLSAIMAARDESKRPEYDGASLPESATLYDDLAPVIVRLLRTPGLVADLVDALDVDRHPKVADLAPLVAQLATESAYVYMNQGQIDYTEPGATIGALGKPVRRDLPDSDVDHNSGNAANNRSILQRLLNLVHDANNLVVCSKPGAEVEIIPLLYKKRYERACELFRINDLALMYLLSFADESVKSSKDTFAWHAANFVATITDDVMRGLLGDNLITDGTIRLMVGIPGFSRYPAPQAAARLLFMDAERRSSFLKGALDTGPCEPRRQGTICCNQNHSFIQHHDGVLFALEQLHPRDGQGREKRDVDFFSAFRPIVNAFARHAECFDRGGQRVCRNAAKILVDLLAVLHRHWPSERSTLYDQRYEPQNQKAGVVRYEPLLAAILQKTDLWPSTLALAKVLRDLPQQGGGGLPVITRFLSWFFDPAARRLGGELRYLGDADGSKKARRGDGQLAFRTTDDPFIVDVLEKEAAGRVTPYFLLADGLRSKRERLAADPRVMARWNRAVSQVADLFLLSRGAPDHRFRNARFRPVSLALLDLVRERVAAHGRQGDLGMWVRKDLMAKLSWTLTGPVFAALAELSDRLGENEGARIGLQRLLLRLIDAEAERGPTFQATLSVAADFLQLLLDEKDMVPLLRALSSAFDPDEGAVAGGLDLLRRSREYDREQVLLTILRGLFRADADGSYPLFSLLEAIREITRARAGEPGVARGPLSAADMEAILGSVGRFIGDKDRGLARLVDIVAGRK